MVKKTILFLAMILFAAMVLCSCTQQPFRLHVIANSDSGVDQQVKLAVRDAVLAATSQGVLECENAAQAQVYIEDNMQTILAAANATLLDNGADYTASATIGNYHFPEKTYQDVTYEQGEYQALRIILGKGEGENWWCVMFPPLCLSEIGDLYDEGEPIEPDEYGESFEETQYKSFFAEIFASWLNKTD